MTHTERLTELVRAAFSGRWIRSYEPDDVWSQCVLKSLGPSFVRRDDAIRDAFYWVIDNLGRPIRRLVTDGQVHSGLKRAIARGIRSGQIEAQGSQEIRAV